MSDHEKEEFEHGDVGKDEHNSEYKDGEVSCQPCEVEEGEAQRAVRAPYTPTQAERDEHELTHFPYRAWCDHCVKGRAKDDPHRTVTGELGESNVTRVVLDYCFLNEDLQASNTEHEDGKDKGTSMTILAMVETMCMSVWSYAVERKGGGETWVTDQITEDLQTVGTAEERVIIKSDQEASITDMAKEIAKNRSGFGTAIEHSKVGDSNSNGKVERAIQDLKGLIRTLRSALEEKTEQKITLSHPIVPWMVRHAGHLITKCRVRSNGRTSYQMMKGRRSNAKMVPFGEAVLFKIPKTQYKVGSFEDRWEQGIWTGFVMRTGEHLVATEKGVFRVATVLRRSSDKRWSAELLNKITGSPQDPVPGSNQKRIPAFAKKFENEKAEQAVFIPVTQEEQEVRSAYIYKTDVDKHGPTPKCPGCRALANGARYRARHTPECRKRFEELLSQDDGGARFAAAKRRRDDHDARETQKIVDKSVELESTRLDRPVNEQDIGKNDIDKEAQMAEPVTASSEPSRGGGSTAMQDDTIEPDKDGKFKNTPAAQEAKTRTDAAIQKFSSSSSSSAGVKRKPEEPADDSARLNTDMEAQKEEKQGTKRKPEGEADDSARMEERPDDMSSVDAGHPGPIGGDKKPCKADLEWRHIGSGIMAKTFMGATHMVTTSRGGPAAQDVHRRVIRSLRTGRIIDDCIPDDTPDAVMNRAMRETDDIRIELTMKGAEKMFQRTGVDVAEVYSQPRIVQEAALRTYDGTRLVPGWSLDLTLCDPSTGEPWNLADLKVQARVRKLVVETKPFLLIGSPPCTMFSSLQNLNKGKADKDEWSKRMKEAEKHLAFCMELYRLQIQGRRFFLHEHPHNATSWKMKEVVQLMSEVDVQITECDMCAYGLVIKDGDEMAFARKRTKLMSNSPEIIKRCSRRCTNEGAKAPESGERLRVPTDEAARPKLSGVNANRAPIHKHANLMGNKAKQCQVYPRDFCRAVCAGVAAQKRLYSLGMMALDLLSFEEINEITGKTSPSAELHEPDGEVVAYDDQSGAELDPEKVAAARLEEIVYFRQMGVYEKVDVKMCWDETGKNPIAVRWVDINKGDEQNPNYRSRLVAKEYRDDIKPELYAATPPGECLRLLLSRMASDRKLKLLYADVSRAYFYAKAVRPVYVKLPDEDRGPEDEGKCGRLLMSMYGTRDAAVNWASEYTQTLVDDGYIQGVSNPCLFYHKERDVSVMVHGDDFIAIGTDDNLDATKKTLEDKYKLKTERLGVGKHDLKEVRILNKVVRVEDGGVRLEADPRHAEIVIKELGLEKAKAARAPGTKEEKRKDDKRYEEQLDTIHVGYEDGDVEDLNNAIKLIKSKYLLSAEVVHSVENQEDIENAIYDEDEELEPGEARRYRAIAARLNYLAADRIDVQYAVKESARAMSRPKKSHWKMLNRIGRYLVGRPRVVIKFDWQVEQDIITAYTDSDWAGCIRTARSTSGGIITVGSHVIKSYSRQQKTVALSSAEAELYAMVAGSAEALAIIAYCADLGKKVKGELYTDSNAALGISQRAGIGKVRHLRTQGLWVQEARTTGRLVYKKVLGTKNPADILTKHVAGDLLDRHLETVGVVPMSGRAESAPELMNVQDGEYEVESQVEWYVTEAEGTQKSINGVAAQSKGEISKGELRDTSGKHVKFSKTVQFRGIPWDNAGRECGRGRDEVKFQRRETSIDSLSESMLLVSRSVGSGFIYQSQVRVPMTGKSCGNVVRRSSCRAVGRSTDGPVKRRGSLGFSPGSTYNYCMFHSNFRSSA